MKTKLRNRIKYWTAYCL